MKGVFEKPEYSEMLKEYVVADPDAIAKALARNYHWTIAPCGNTALYLLGLSTQVTAVWVDDAYFWGNLKGKTRVQISFLFC